jgi:hypothetical protein
MNSIRLTEEEIRQQKMDIKTLAMAKHFFDVQGFLKIDNLFSKEFIAGLSQAYDERLRWKKEDQDLSSGVKVSDKRYIVPISLTEPFNDPRLYDNPILMPLLEAILGPRLIVGSMGAVTALPGAMEQHIHADYTTLFEEDLRSSCSIPTYAITFAVPLIDIDCINGPTKIWPGSHRTYPIEQKMHSYPMDLLYGETGSCYFWDYRTFHAGGSNHSDTPRSLLYMSYTICWFKDFFNTEELQMETKEYHSLAPKQKKLFLSLQNQAKMQNVC